VKEVDIQVQGLFDDVRLTRVGWTISYRSWSWIQSLSPSSSHAMGAGPRTLVDIGKIAVLPTCRTEGSSLYEEW
jgi:hypothetical protein